MNKEGPTKIEYSAYHCTGCKWLCSKLFMSGPRPIYNYFCTHEGADNGLPFVPLFEGEDNMIGENDYTPDWCPIKNNK